MNAWSLVIGLGLAALGCARSDELQPFTCAHTCLVPTVSTDPALRFPPGTVFSFNEHRLAVDAEQAQRELLREVLAQSQPSTPGISCCALCEEDR